MTTNKTTPPTAASFEPLMVTELAACSMLQLGRTTLCHLRNSGQIKSVLVKTRKGNISGRRMYPVDALRAYVEGLQAQAECPGPSGAANLANTETKFSA